MDHFMITPNGTTNQIPAEFIGVLVDPENNRPRPLASWLGTQFAGTEQADKLVCALMRGDAAAAQEIIECAGQGMLGHLGDHHADWLCGVLPDEHDVSWSVSSGPGRTYDRCSVSLHSGIAYVRHGGRVHLFSVGAAS